MPETFKRGLQQILQWIESNRKFQLCEELKARKNLNLSRSKEKEAAAKQTFTFLGAIPTKSQVRSTADTKWLDFGGEQLDKLEVVGECDGKEIVRNDFGRTVAVIPYIFNRTSILLARMVF